MKKATLFAAIAAVAITASAQYEVTPGIENFMERIPAKGTTIYGIVLGESLQSELTGKGYQVEQGMILNDNTTHWYWWAGWAGGDDSYPDPDFSTDGYIAQTVTGDAGWSGGGTTVDAGAGFNTTKIGDDAVLHVTLRSANQPASLGMIFMDGPEVGSAPAKLSFGDAAFDDNGVIFPLVGSLPKDGDWVCYELKFSDIKKLWPEFNAAKVADWHGNGFVFLSGNTAGTGFGVCESFIYTTNEDSAVETISVDNNARVEYFNLQGVRVANPEKGMYIKRQGSKVIKVAL